MSERIVELRKQAAAYFWSLNEHTPPEEYDNKLAELVIRECLRKIDDLIDFTDYPNDTEKSMVELKTLRDAKKVIKEHFGLQ